MEKRRQEGVTSRHGVSSILNAIPGTSNSTPCQCSGSERPKKERQANSKLKEDELARPTLHSCFCRTCSLEKFHPHLPAYPARTKHPSDITCPTSGRCCFARDCTADAAGGKNCSTQCPMMSNPTNAPAIFEAVPKSRKMQFTSSQTEGS